MSAALIIVGAVIVLIGIGAIARPRQLLRIARRVEVSIWLRLLAFVIRIGLGTLLILVAPATAFPLLVRIIGSLLIVSGVAVLVLGDAGVQRLMSWFLRLGPPAIVVGGIVGILFGVLLIYAGA